ncbi:MAG: heat-inducible transcriptional repressor HrcA [Chloroflexi bacterium]|nr:heat-inducible transcriptional repressor HrcA [Chloroflexota bacterium]MCY3582103.1 heat-inducible transcriptional repressor HrcA [Chloroflexota bacterium]MCY3715547.1 heat-inducible transcriptional repressor HrcA [Chloroflexota bacterium]MDE2650715.1 heat-inducible transcriptional repressor HrcA [Chloroflexota bacterium]MXV92652.1 heat-inducible transcription repressor HrcA [Chloroflexota bacterium]
MAEDYHLPDLSSRQEAILTCIVQAYSEKPEPVSSGHLVENFQLNISSATVRNEMAQLEELGYIAAPHTSAGRLPTAAGFRYFVRRLLQNHSLTRGEQSHISERVGTLRVGMEQWMRRTAALLSRSVQTASIVTPPIAQTNTFKHVELISIQGRLALMVLVLHSGSVHQRMLTLADAVPQAKLAEAAKRVNELCTGLGARQVRLRSINLPMLDREVADLTAELIETADNNQVRFIYRDGLSRIIESFADEEAAQQAIRILEEHTVLNALLNDLLGRLPSDAPGEALDVRVVIAGDGRYQDLSRLSMVLSRYGDPGKMSGAIGVLGPTHINYGRAISTVRYVSNLMTNVLATLYQDGVDEGERGNI